jgi:hypothetical protein
LNAVGSAEALCGDGRLEEAEQRNEEGGAHGVTDDVHLRQLEGPAECEEVSGRGLDLAENVDALVLPVELPRQDDGDDDNEEAVGDVGDPVVARLQALLELAHHEHEDETDGGHDDGELVGTAEVPDNELDLVDAAAVANTRLGGVPGQAELGDELVDGDDETNGRDEAAQERPAEDAVEEAEARKTGEQDDSTRHTTHDTADPCVQHVVVLLAGIDAALHNGSDQQGAGSLRANNHLRAASKQGVNQRVDDKGVQAVDGRDMGQVLGVGQDHGEVDGGDGQGRDKVALEVGPPVLGHPGHEGEVVGEVHGGVGLEASLLGEGVRVVHAAGHDAPRPALFPVVTAGDGVDDGIYQTIVRHGGRVGIGAREAGYGALRSRGEGAVAARPLVCVFA